MLFRITPALFFFFFFSSCIFPHVSFLCLCSFLLIYRLIFALSSLLSQSNFQSFFFFFFSTWLTSRTVSYVLWGMNCYFQLPDPICCSNWWWIRDDTHVIIHLLDIVCFIFISACLNKHIDWYCDVNVVILF